MALPNLGTLSLRPAAVQPTGEFWSLSRKEADERNEGGGVEPLTQDEYVPSQDLSDGGEYFRVRYKYRNTPSFKNPDAAKYLYYMFDAEKLWESATHTQGLNPLSREKIWREDWRELRDKYAPGAPEPGFVARLPSLGNSVRVREGGRPEGRLVRIEWPDRVLYFEGDKGEERRVREEWSDGEVVYLKGNNGNEHMVRVERPNGKVWYLEGDKGEEHVVRIVTRSGQVQYYEGYKNEERKVRIEFTSGNVRYYEGDKGEERLVRTVLPDGTVE